MPAFDAYVMVDWSASNVPKHGPNSIWVCTWERHAKAMDRDHLSTRNSHTRSEAVNIVRAFLQQQARARRRTLVGFDFAYGYPSGFAAAIGVRGGRQPWRQTWHRLSDNLHDTAGNESSRFQLAAGFNGLIGNPPGPFWGHHPARPANPCRSALPRWRGKHGYGHGRDRRSWGILARFLGALTANGEVASFVVGF